MLFRSLHLISGTINALYFRVDHSVLMLSSLQLAKGVLLGIGVTLLAVLAPAWEATRLSPQSAMLRSQLESGMRRLMQTAALLSLVLILGSIGLAMFSGKDISLGLGSVFLMLLGFALLTPQVTFVLMTLLERMLARSPRILARLPAPMLRAAICRSEARRLG